MNKAQITALVILLAGVAWIGSGVISGQGANTSNANADNTAPLKEAPAVAVRVQNSAARAFQSDITLQGRTAASRIVDLRAEVSGRAEDILVFEGQPVEAGQPVLQIAINDRAARLDQARASLELARSGPICPRPHAPPRRRRAGRHTRQVGQPRRHAHAHAERLLLRPRRGAAARR